MTLPRSYRIDGNVLLEEIDELYQDLREWLNLEFKPSPRCVLVNILLYAVEDNLNLLTSNRFRDHVSLTKNFIIAYLENETGVMSDDLEEVKEIENGTVASILSEVEIFLRKIRSGHDQYYSKWKVEINEDHFITIDYLGDFRIDEWHKIQKVSSRKDVTVIEYRIKLEEIYNVFRNVLDDKVDYALSDLPGLLEVIVEFYNGSQTTELHNEIISYLCKLNGPGSNKRKHYSTYKANHQLNAIIKGLKEIRQFDDYIHNATIGEKNTYSISRSRLIIRILPPSSEEEQSELREKLLDEIDNNGYISNDLMTKVKVKYG